MKIRDDVRRKKPLTRDAPGFAGHLKMSLFLGCEKYKDLQEIEYKV